MPYRANGQHAVTPQHRGRYPGFDVLDQVAVWDDVTAGVVLGRLRPPAGWSFFSADEIAVATPLFDILLAQDTEPRVPALELVDARLAAGETDGWHYDDLPPDTEAWRTTLAMLDTDAAQRHPGARGFSDLSTADQREMVRTVADLAGRSATWQRWSAAHVWSLWTRYACTAFYSHPWAWNEIGFPGPAYPRGYLNPGVNAREHWEAPDRATRDADVDPVRADESWQRSEEETR